MTNESLPVEAEEDAITDLKRKLESIIPAEWEREDLDTLRVIATDIAGLTSKIASSTDPTKTAHYKRRIELLVQHVAVLAYSRLNVTENNVSAALKRFLVEAVRAAVFSA